MGVVISIHALREEGDDLLARHALRQNEFLSTPSARRATHGATTLSVTMTDFYPRPPRGGRRDDLRQGTCAKDFYPRPPRGGRQHTGLLGAVGHPISIHALREEGDLVFVAHGHRQGISIHALREEGDPAAPPVPAGWCIFLSTPSARRATRRRSTGLLKPSLFLSTPSARRATWTVCG